MNAKNKGVTKIVCAASSFSSNQKAVEIAEEHPGVVLACAGLDPMHCIKEKKAGEAADFARQNEKRIAAIGEVGLDYYRLARSDEQLRLFRDFVSLAVELNKPVVVHARDAVDDALRVLSGFDARVMMHCFSGSMSQARECVGRGYMLSFATSACFLEDRKSLIKSVPLDYILAETDSPCNHPQRKGRNEPANVRFAYELIAGLLGQHPGEVEKTIDKNAEKFFSIRV
jgi:TatD DNase family protein